MHITSRFLLFFALFSLFGGYASSQTAKYSNDFLAIGSDARAMSMGNASLSQNGNATALFYNPAIFDTSHLGIKASLLHAEYFAGGAQYDVAAVNWTKPKESFGLGIIRLGIDDIPNTLNLYDPNGNINYNNITRFSAADYALFINYARQHSSTFSFGGNIKLIYRQIGPFAKAYGFGFDLGIVKTFRKYKLAATLKDATSTFSLWTFSESELSQGLKKAGNLFPEGSLELTLPTLSLGISREFDFNSKFSLLSECNLTIFSDGKRNTPMNLGPLSLFPALGLEASYKRLLFVRTGLNNLKQIPWTTGNEISIQPNFGIGIKFQKFKLDYALTNIGDKNQGMFSNVFALHYSF